MSADNTPSSRPSLTMSKKTGKFDQAPLPDKIGRSLRQIYDDVLSEEVPDDFLSILQNADDQDNGEVSQ